ncbi:TlpA family protein disulfide reductase [Formosa sp. Hel1_33_131]|jgi:peroxiredoxin|uniref:TlpA family protein disulfide reductase n=1 Tax=Formosa sp. Hel1_33_131 TaxID=1336794 RepID=UPI00084E1CCC|nr:TlpA disulfide reductase family protein [Formosa sp. Hel1_33_131]
MKRSLIIALTLLLFLNHNGYSQEPTDDPITIDENTLIKDEAGNKIDVLKLMELLDSAEWSMDPVKDKDGKLLYMQMRKATEEERKEMGLTSMLPNSTDIIGKPAPNFKMTDLNGNEISSETTKGKVVVLNFWFVSCKPCIAEIPELNEVYKTYKNNTEVVFASITFDEKEKVVTFLEKYPLQYPVVSDAKEICTLFNTSSYPTNIVIDKNGNFYDHVSGGFPEIGHQISNSIQNALEGK